MFSNLDLAQPVVGQARAVDTRIRVMTEAAKLFAARGFNGTSLREIAAAAGVKHPIIKYHFESKTQLWVLIVRELFLQFRAVGEDFSFDPDKSIEEQLNEQLFQIVSYIAHNPHLFRIVFRESSNDSELMDLIDDEIAEWTMFTTNYYKQVQALGVCPSIPLSDFHAIFEGAVVHRYIFERETEVLTGRSPTDQESIRSHAESITKVLLGI